MRSKKMTGGLEKAPHRSLLYALGMSKDEINRPLIGICNAANEIIPGHVHLHNITRAVKSVADGKYYLSPELSGFLKTGSRNRASTAAENDLLKTLTPAELNIIKLTSELKSNNEIAEILFISKRTVENHRVNIAHKLNLGSAKKLLKFAVKNKDLLE